MFKEGDKRGCYGGYLVGRDVHKVNIFATDDRIVCLKTAFDPFVGDKSVLCNVYIGLGHHFLLLILCTHIDNPFGGHVYFTFVYFAVRCFNKTKVVDFCVDTK
ncbi:hypothetical protein SDC9_78565 [bioreactor metagenome]|uniref:Uncharacterized protein n=1 Tax=bioreactor metagenome TaxID=1076179 RepID=A0A644YUL6_9ZZZZ